MSEIAADLRNVASSAELMEIGRKAIEDELIEWRDARRFMLRNNGFAVREKDGTPSGIIRFGPEFGVAIALRAIAEHLDGRA